MDLATLSQAELARLDPERMAPIWGVTCAQARDMRNAAIRAKIWPNGRNPAPVAEGLFRKPEHGM